MITNAVKKNLFRSCHSEYVCHSEQSEESLHYHSRRVCHSEQSEESLLRSESKHPTCCTAHQKKPTLPHFSGTSAMHLYNWNKQPIFNVPVFKVLQSYTQAPAKGFGVFKGDCISQILCGIGLHKTLPSHKVRSVGVLLSPEGYRETGVRTFQVLLILRRKGGKCRSHTNVFLGLWNDGFGCEEDP